jgi:hypothetical protein
MGKSALEQKKEALLNRVTNFKSAFLKLHLSLSKKVDDMCNVSESLTDEQKKIQQLNDNIGDALEKLIINIKQATRSVAIDKIEADFLKSRREIFKEVTKPILQPKIKREELIKKLKERAAQIQEEDKSFDHNHMRILKRFIFALVFNIKPFIRRDSFFKENPEFLSDDFLDKISTQKKYCYKLLTVKAKVLLRQIKKSNEEPDFEDLKYQISEQLLHFINANEKTDSKGKPTLSTKVEMLKHIFGDRLKMTVH